MFYILFFLGFIMPEQTSVKFFTYDMLRMPSVVPNNLSSIRDLLRFCLVNGSPEVAVTSATVTAGVCRMTVAAGNSFSFQSVVLCSGFDQAGANGEHRVTATSDLWFEFETDLPDGPLSGAAMKAKYAPAGWMEPFAADSTTMVIRSKNTNPKSRRYFLQIKETTYQYIQVRAFKTMTDLNNGLIPIPTTAQNPNGYYWAKSAENNANPRAWFIIASDKFFYYGINHYYSLTIDRVPFMGCFGDFVTDNVNDKYNVVLRGGNTINDATSIPISGYDFGCSHITPHASISISGSPSTGDNPLSGMFYANVPNWYNSYGLSGANQFGMTNPSTGGYNLFRYNIVDTLMNPRGYLPGALYIGNNLQNAATFYSLNKGTGDFENKYLFGTYTPGGASYYNYTVTQNNSSYMFFDITGPWE